MCHLYFSRQTSTARHRHPPSVATTTGHARLAFSGLQQLSPVWSSLLLLGGLPQLTSSSTRSPLKISSVEKLFYEQQAPARAIEVQQFFGTISYSGFFADLVISDSISRETSSIPISIALPVTLSLFMRHIVCCQISVP